MTPIVNEILADEIQETWKEFVLSSCRNLSIIVWGKPRDSSLLSDKRYKTQAVLPTKMSPKESHLPKWQQSPDVHGQPRLTKESPNHRSGELGLKYIVTVWEPSVTHQNSPLQVWQIFNLGVYMWWEWKNHKLFLAFVCIKISVTKIGKYTYVFGLKKNRY